jgi:anti-anti-sigma factor
MTTTVEDSRSVGHALAVPESTEQLWEMSAAFLAHGLAAGEQVIYFDDGHSDAVLERLADDGVAVAEPMREGRFTVVPGTVPGAPLRTLPEIGETLRAAIDGAVTAGYPAVRMTGRVDKGMVRTSSGAMIDLDRVVDKMVRGRPAHVLCCYDHMRFPDDVVTAMREMHDIEVVSPAIYDDGLLRLTATGPASARVAGEVDHSNRPRIRKLLEAALDRALRAPDAPRDITLDLSSLRFLDVAGAVGLVHAAEEFPNAHRLVLSGVRPGVQRILDRCGAPFAAQLVVRGRTAPPDSAPPDSAPSDHDGAPG